MGAGIAAMLCGADCVVTDRRQRAVGARLFCTIYGSPMSTSYVRQLLPRLARKAGIAKRVHPHGLRHTHP
jgi:site-specific recombinase XerD